jgi:siroheme synthase
LFITGHLKDGNLDLDWVAMSRPRQTVVIYMGLVGLAEICEKLIMHMAFQPICLSQWCSRAQPNVNVLSRLH